LTSQNSDHCIFNACQLQLSTSFAKTINFLRHKVASVQNKTAELVFVRPTVFNLHMCIKK